jgi:glycine cleavage system H protein
MSSPADRRYSESHEWFQVDADTVTIGITSFATGELADITYVEMKAPGTAVAPGDSVGEVESVKTASEIYSAVGGEIIEVNEALTDDPAVVNSDPFGAGWLVRIRASDTGALQNLMDQATYDEKHPGG